MQASSEEWGLAPKSSHITGRKSNKAIASLAAWRSASNPRTTELTKTVSILTPTPLYLAISHTIYFFFPFWANALPAADFDVLLALPSRRVFEAAFAAGLEVCFFGALLCDNALPAADLDSAPVDLLFRVLEAADAAFLLVTFLFGIFIHLFNVVIRPQSHV